MSDSKPSAPKPARPGRTAGPQAALDALLADAAFDPLRRALWLDALDQRLRPALPPSLATHARLANLDGGRLVYVVDAPVWRAKLRLAGPDIVEAARSLGLGVDELVVKVATGPLHPPAHPPERANRKATPMSAAARDALQAALASLKGSDKPEPEDF